ncbi:cupin domain-containing protein [Roseomonas frigidaquae]|uniref:Cupin domain-containing protein n=1 Tax=Falsiroseomonas frigidaquae TaxID=487318 RepID=A0ABX1F563_9PROT|nr:cupin domain-containing protein [Falsiroseomonas frigidaquae]NKE47389.1 cupin domain-containing protein [Falsiroseomonas frigidaquae]
MDRTAFEAALPRAGFTESVGQDLPAGDTTPEHSHNFDARLLILSGSLILESGGTRRSYGPGEVFEVPRDTPHAEIAGATGVSYIAGRRR